MPGFITISPTHLEGKKEYAWKNFLSGGYIAIGWMHDDLTNKTLEEIFSIIRKHKFDNEVYAIESFKKFLSLKIGDYVAVNNVNAGLFGVGTVTSNYYHKLNGHNTGIDSIDDHYSHFRSVDWKYPGYVKRMDLIGPGETGWAPYGTMGVYWDEAPPYIKRLTGEAIPVSTTETVYETPDFLLPVKKMIERLKTDPKHTERAHESLVEDFLCAIGYEKHEDIKFQKGRVDVFLSVGGFPLAVIEVKKHWDLSNYRDHGAIKQAYEYALQQGIRYVIITNGDNYILFDRLKGLSFKSNIIGEFALTSLKEEDLEIIERLRKDNLMRPNLEELFINISESFRGKHD